MSSERLGNRRWRTPHSAHGARGLHRRVHAGPHFSGVRQVAVIEHAPASPRPGSRGVQGRAQPVPRRDTGLTQQAIYITIQHHVRELQSPLELFLLLHADLAAPRTFPFPLLVVDVSLDLFHWNFALSTSHAPSINAAEPGVAAGAATTKASAFHYRDGVPASPAGALTRAQHAGPSADTTASRRSRRTIPAECKPLST